MYIFPFCGTEVIFCPYLLCPEAYSTSIQPKCLCYFLNLTSGFNHLQRLVSRDWLQFRAISKEVMYTHTNYIKQLPLLAELESAFTKLTCFFLEVLHCYFLIAYNLFVYLVGVN